MARLSVSVALLFFFFAFSPSVARIQISKPKYDVIVRQLTNPLPRSDVKASLRLPSQSNKVKIHPLERRPEVDGKVVRSDQKNRPIQKLQDSNAQKARPVQKLPDPNAQKAQPVNRRAESVEKKPIMRLPYLALPDLIAVKNRSELPIEKNNEESKIFEVPADLDMIIKAQLESIEEEQSKPESEAQPKPNKPVEPETKAAAAAAAVEALPLKEVNFRLRSRLPYRLCRHSHLHHIEENLPLPSRSSQAEISYGNDMIYTFGENGDFDPEVFSGTFNHVPPKMFPFLHHHRQHDVNVEEVSKHLPKPAQERVSYFLVENDSEKVDNDHRHRVLPKTIPFLHRNGPRNLRRQDAIQKVSNHRLPENNNHGKDSNHRLTENNRGSSVSHIPRKWIPLLHDVNKEKKPEKKESNLRKRIRKFLGQYFD